MGSTKTFFFGKCFKNKLLNIFSNFFFYLKVQCFWLIMENIVIQIAASAGHAIAYTIILIIEMIVSIIKHTIDNVQLYFTNCFRNIVLLSVNCRWLVGVTLIFDGSPQIIVQLCQIAAPKWPNYINSAADNTIFKNRAQNSECNFGCVARSAAKCCQYPPLQFL